MHSLRIAPFAVTALFALMICCCCCCYGSSFDSSSGVLSKASKTTTTTTTTTHTLHRRSSGSSSSSGSGVPWGKIKSPKPKRDGSARKPYDVSARVVQARRSNAEIGREKKEEKRTGVSTRLKLGKRSAVGGGGGGEAGGGGHSPWGKKGTPKNRLDGSPRKPYTVSPRVLQANRANAAKGREKKEVKQKGVSTRLKLGKRSGAVGGGEGGGGGSGSSGGGGGKSKPTSAKDKWFYKTKQPYSPLQRAASRANAQKARDAKAKDRSQGITTKLTLRRRSTTGGNTYSTATSGGGRVPRVKKEAGTPSRPYKQSPKSIETNRANAAKGRQALAEKRKEALTRLKLRRRSSSSSQTGGKLAKPNKAEYAPLRKTRPYTVSPRSTEAHRKSAANARERKEDKRKGVDTKLKLG